MINSLASVPVVGTQHLSYLFAYNLDGHNCQHISGSPQLDRNRRKRTLRNKKFIYWFFTSIIKEFQRDGIIAREGSSQGQNHRLGHVLFFQLNISSEGANIISSPFYPREGTRCAEKVFGGSRHKIGSNREIVLTNNNYCRKSQYQTQWRIFLSFKFLSVASTITSTEAVAQNERGYVYIA